MRLLLAEDDTRLAARLQQELASAGYAVDRAEDGIEAQFLGETEDYDLVVLDLGLPRRPGLEVLSNWRGKNLSMPVLILTARDTWRDKVDGLKSGADDYLTKPFHPEELLARVAALIRRSHGHAAPELSTDGLRLDESHQSAVLDDGTEVGLTGTEFRLLRCFMLNPGKLMSKTRLTEHVYDQSFDRDSNLIEVYVRRLRDKIGRGRIETRRGQGYVLKG